MEVHGPYIAIKDFIRRDRTSNQQPPSISPDYQVTLTTTSTPEFLHHLLELTRRWGPEGLLSVAVYVPGTDYLLASNIIAALRRCSPAIRRQVDWHLVYDRAHPPKGLNLSASHFENAEKDDNDKEEEEEEGLSTYDESYFQYHHFQRCSCDSSKALFAKCLASNAALRPSYKRRHSLTYPINVLRNVARTAATATRYLLASDIELYTSADLAAAFSAFIAALEAKEEEEDKALQQSKPRRRRVFMLPIFEVNATIEAPETKRALMAAFERGQAQFFHASICDECQRFPGRGDWITSINTSVNSSYFTSNQSGIRRPDPLQIFGVTKRTAALGLRHWEPIYIGTHAEPLYDERLSWEGKLDKMSQMYELCLLDYDIVILDNGFIVHAPGIKQLDPEDSQRRAPFLALNRPLYEEALWSLRLLYGVYDSPCD